MSMMMPVGRKIVSSDGASGIGEAGQIERQRK